MSRWDLYPFFFLLIGVVLFIIGLIVLVINRNKNPNDKAPTSVYVLVFTGIGIATIGAILAFVLLYQSGS